MPGPIYSGQRDGLHWWDTDVGPFGLTPDMAAPFLPPAPPAPEQVDGMLPGLAAPVATPSRPAAPAQDLGAALSAGPSVTVNNDYKDYKGKRRSQRVAADRARVDGAMAQQDMRTYAPPPEASPPQRVRFDGSLESALGEQAQAYDDAGQAVVDKAAVDMDLADREAVLREEGMARRAALEAQHAKQRAKEQAEFDRTHQAFAQANEQFAKMEVDRDRIWKDMSTGRKVAVGVMAALGAIGSAMKRQGDRNPALDAIMAAINADVEEQMANIDKAGRNVDMRRGMVSDLMQIHGNREAARAAAISAGIANVEEQIALAAAKSGSAQVKANAGIALADLGQRRADANIQGAQALFGQNMQRAQLEEQRRARAAAAAQAAARLRWDQQQFMMQREADIAAAQAAGDGKRAVALAEDTKDLQARGIFDPRTGRPMLQPEGEKMWKEAETLRAKGDTAGAAGLESEAIAQHALRTGDGKDVRKLMGSVQDAVTLADDIARMRAEHGANWTKSSEGEQWMTSKAAILAMTLKDAYQLGALDKGSQEVITQITGGDPSKISASDVPLLGSLLGGAKGNKGSLDAVVDALSARAQTSLRAVGYRGEWKPRREPQTGPVATADEASLQGAEASEAAFDGMRAMGMGNAYRGRDAWGGVTVAPQAQAVIDANFALAARGNADARRNLEVAKTKGGGLGRAAEQALAKLDGFVTSSGFKASRVGSRLNADGTVTPPAGAVAAYPGAAR